MNSRDGRKKVHIAGSSILNLDYIGWKIDYSAGSGNYSQN